MRNLKGLLLFAAAAAFMLAGVVFYADTAIAADKVFCYLDEKGIRKEKNIADANQITGNHNTAGPTWGAVGTRLLLTQLIQTELL